MLSPTQASADVVSDYFTLNDPVVTNLNETVFKLMKSDSPNLKPNSNLFNSISFNFSDYKDITDILCSCGMKVKNDLYKTHINNDCGLRFIRCPICNASVIARALEKHNKKCRKKRMICDIHGCGFVAYSGDEITSHQNNMEYHARHFQHIYVNEAIQCNYLQKELNQLSIRYNLLENKMNTIKQLVGGGGGAAPLPTPIFN